MFKKHQKRAPDNLFVETRLGIVTRSGDWFHTTSDEIEEYVPGLLDQRPLDELIETAQAWIESANGIALLLLMLLLIFSVNPLLSAAIVLAVHWAWYHSKSGLVNLSMTSILKFMNTDAFMFVTALIVLSVLGMEGEYSALGIGIIFFFLLKLNLLKKLWDYLDQRGSDKELLLNDRVLKMVIIKYAMYEDVAPTEIKRMEERFKELAFKRNTKN
jgi:hypothetical protein